MDDNISLLFCAAVLNTPRTDMDPAIARAVAVETPAEATATADPADASDADGAGPLSAEDLAQFERDGFCKLRGAFPRAVARECRAALWRHLADPR